MRRHRGRRSCDISAQLQQLVLGFAHFLRGTRRIGKARHAAVIHDLRHAQAGVDVALDEACDLLRCAVRRERQQRSEEHTSELQSLMRISYAVFCLKNINKQYNATTAISVTSPVSLHYIFVVGSSEYGNT